MALARGLGEVAGCPPGSRCSLGETKEFPLVLCRAAQVMGWVVLGTRGTPVSQHKDEGSSALGGGGCTQGGSQSPGGQHGAASTSHQTLGYFGPLSRTPEGLLWKEVGVLSLPTMEFPLPSASLPQSSSHGAAAAAGSLLLLLLCSAQRQEGPSAAHDPSVREGDVNEQ